MPKTIGVAAQQTLNVGDNQAVHDSAALTFLALGPLEVRRSGTVVDLGRPLQRALLGVLLDAAPRAVPVESLIDALWPADPPGDPLRSLQVYVSSLRKVLGRLHGDEVVRTEGRAYRLHLSPDTGARYDVREFDEAADEIAELERSGAHADVAERAAQALTSWRGAAWQDLRHVPRLDASGARLDERRLDVLAAAATARLALGLHRELVADLENAVRSAPLREDLRGHLMLALHRSGRQSDAAEVFREGRDLKVEATGLDPSEEIEHLHRRILADDPTLRVEDAALRARRHLPAQTTRMHGRAVEVRDLLDLVRSPGCRLVTLTGPGGIGKTRLATRVAHELAIDFPDGVWFVGLADVRDADLVPPAVADALDGVVGDSDPAAAVKLHVADRTMLLVCDNLEQVEDAGPFLTDVLAAGAGCRIIATSRTRLRLYGEHVREVAPLGPADAVPLFVDRATAADARFDPSAVDAIQTVCRALDGVPLALELVAARAGEVDLYELVGQLDSKLDLAAEGPRDRDPRQRSMRAAITWSVELLSPSAASAFRRLGVFVGGFDAEAADEVADARATDLEALVGASLLREEEGRYRMLEVVREHSRELGADELSRLEAAHADHFLRIAEASVERGRGEERARWHVRLQAERGNCRAALAHYAAQAGHDAKPAELLLRMASALGIFWYFTGPVDADVALLELALETAAEAPAEVRARGYYAAAICRAEQGRAEAALEHSLAAYRLVEHSDDPAWVARALNTLAGLLRDLGRAAEAIPMMERGIALRRELQLPALPPTLALANRAMAAMDVGDPATARRCLEECLDDEDDVEVAMIRRLLAEVALEEGRLEEARQHLIAALTELRAREQVYRLIESLDTLAWLAVVVGRPEDAATLLAAADQALADEDSELVPADAELRRRRTARALASLDPGVREAAEARGRELGLHGALDLGQSVTAE